MLLQRILNLLVLKSINLLNPVLHLLAFTLQPQVQLTLQLEGLLLLSFALVYLAVMPLQLCDDFLFFQFQLAKVTLNFLGSLKFFVGLLLIVNLPSLLHVFLVLDHAFIGHDLFFLDRRKEIIPVELLDFS